MKKENLSIIISIVAIIISIVSLSYAILDNNKTKCKYSTVWCSANLSESTITGEITGKIIEVSKANRNQRANILVEKNDGSGNIVVSHNSNLEFKVGQIVKIEHDGINESNPPQTAAVCIEIIKDNSVNIGEKSKFEVSDNLVSLTVKEGSLTNLNATLILENHTNNNYLYGTPYSIEHEKNGIWYEIIPLYDMYFTMQAIGLEAKQSIEIELNWEHAYGKLPTGKYRVIKDVFRELDKPLEEEILYIAAEFTLT